MPGLFRVRAGSPDDASPRIGGLRNRCPTSSRPAPAAVAPRVPLHSQSRRKSICGLATYGAKPKGGTQPLAQRVREHRDTRAPRGRHNHTEGPDSRCLTRGLPTDGRACGYVHKRPFYPLSHRGGERRCTPPRGCVWSISPRGRHRVFTNRLKILRLFVDEEGSVVALRIHDTPLAYGVIHESGLQTVGAMLRANISSTLGTTLG